MAFWTKSVVFDSVTRPDFFSVDSSSKSLRSHKEHWNCCVNFGMAMIPYGCFCKYESHRDSNFNLQCTEIHLDGAMQAYVLDCQRTFGSSLQHSLHFRLPNSIHFHIYLKSVLKCWSLLARKQLVSCTKPGCSSFDDKRSEIDFDLGHFQPFHFEAKSLYW